jgi:hypothetical protein
LSSFPSRQATTPDGFFYRLDVLPYCELAAHYFSADTLMGFPFEAFFHSRCRIGVTTDRSLLGVRNSRFMNQLRFDRSKRT